MKINVFDIQGKAKDTWEIAPKALGKFNPTLLAQALRVYEWNSHQKTHKVKSRGEVEGSTKKIYRQKGTGRARHGAKYAPIFVGGGIAHGPRGLKPGNLMLPRTLKRRALASALLSKLEDKQVAGLVDTKKSDGKTSSVATLLATIAGHPKNRVILVTKGKTTKLYQGLQNLQGVTTRRADLLTAYDLVSASSVILTKPAFEALLARTQVASQKEAK